MPTPAGPETTHRIAFELASRLGARRVWLITREALRSLSNALAIGSTIETPVRFVEVLEGPELRMPNLRALGKEARERSKQLKKTGAIIGSDPARLNKLLVANVSMSTSTGCSACRLGAHVAVEHLGIVCECDVDAVAVGVSRDVDRTRPLVAELLNEAERPDDATIARVAEGLDTLDARLRHHNDSAMAVASYLACHPGVLTTWYPGLPSHPDHATATTQLQGGFGPWVGFKLPRGRCLKASDALDVVRFGRSTYRLYCGEDPLELCAELERQIP